MSKKLLIETVAGNTIVNADSYVGSDLNGNLFAKRASDINIGEKLYFEKEAIHKTLDDIEKDLMESPRYRTARNSLFVNEQTALSYHLSNSPALKNLNEEERISKLYEAIGKKVTRQTVKNWVSGETVMPELENLELLVQVAPELKSYYEALSEKIEAPEKINVDEKEFLVQYGAKYPLYKLYTNIRQGIMRYVAEAKGKGNGEKKEHKKPLESISLGYEIKIVVDKYFNEISDQMISARVTGIKEIERKDALETASENHEKLRKGVVRLKSEKQDFLKENDLKSTSLSEIMNELAGFEYTVGKFAKRIVKDKIDGDISERTGYWATEVLIREMLSPRNKKFYEPRYWMKEEFEEKLELSSKEEAKRLIKKGLEEREEYVKTFEGMGKELKDAMTQEEHEIFEKLMHPMDMIVNSFPQAYMKFIEIDREIMQIPEKPIYKSMQQFNKRIAEHKRLAKELKDVYGMDDNHFKNKKRFGEDVEEGLQGIALTDEDGKASLKKYRLSDLIPKIFG